MHLGAVGQAVQDGPGDAPRCEGAESCSARRIESRGRFEQPHGTHLAILVELDALVPAHAVQARRDAAHQGQMADHQALGTRLRRLVAGRGSGNRTVEILHRRCAHTYAPAMARISRLQPSISTNSSTFSGSEIDTGGTIIMPSAISTAATTRSISRNGRKMTKPATNAARSSDSMKAGTSTR